MVTSSVMISQTTVARRSVGGGLVGCRRRNPRKCWWKLERFLERRDEATSWPQRRVSPRAPPSDREHLPRRARAHWHLVRAIHSARPHPRALTPNPRSRFRRDGRDGGGSRGAAPRDRGGLLPRVSERGRRAGILRARVHLDATRGAPRRRPRLRRVVPRVRGDGVGVRSVEGLARNVQEKQHRHRRASAPRHRRRGALSGRRPRPGPGGRRRSTPRGPRAASRRAAPRVPRARRHGAPSMPARRIRNTATPASRRGR